MRKEDKGIIIAQIAETVKEYSCFYLAETATLNAEKQAIYVVHVSKKVSK